MMYEDSNEDDSAAAQVESKRVCLAQTERVDLDVVSHRHPNLANSPVNARSTRLASSKALIVLFTTLKFVLDILSPCDQPTIEPVELMITSCLIPDYALDQGIEEATQLPSWSKLVQLLMVCQLVRWHKSQSDELQDSQI